MQGKIISLLAAILLILPAAAADLCILRGYVFNEDGSPARDNTLISMTEKAYDVTYPVYTGGNWPYQNFYLKTFTCMLDDSVGLVVDNGQHYYENSVILDTNNKEFNFTLTAKTVVLVPGDDGKTTSGGGAGSGAGSGNGIVIEPKKLSVTESGTFILHELEEIEIFTIDKWFDVRKHILTAYKINNTEIIILFSDSDKELNIGVGETLAWDLNNDGIDEIKIGLEKIIGGVAYVSFTRTLYPEQEPPVIEKPKPVEELPETDETPAEPVGVTIEMTPVHADNISSKPWLIMILILTVIISITYLKSRHSK